MRTAKETPLEIWGVCNNFYVRIKILWIRVKQDEGMELVSHPFGGLLAWKHFKQCLCKKVVMTLK